jgi:hypothetical protein
MSPPLLSYLRVKIKERSEEQVEKLIHVKAPE